MSGRSRRRGRGARSASIVAEPPRTVARRAPQQVEDRGSAPPGCISSWWPRSWLREALRLVRPLWIDQVVDTVSILSLMLPLYVSQILEVLRPGDEIVRHLLAIAHELGQVALVIIYIVNSVLNFARHLWRARQ